MWFSEPNVLTAKKIKFYLNKIRSINAVIFQKDIDKTNHKTTPPPLESAKQLF